MKTISKIFGLLLMTTIAFSFNSCGSDDDRTEYTLKGALCKHTHDLGIANAGSQVTTAQTSATLEDMLKGYDYEGSINGGTMTLTSGTSIEITGLEDDIILEKFTLTMNDITREFGNINADKSELYTDENQEFFKNVFNKMVSQKKLTVKATYTPSAKITDENPIEINITFKGDFTYLY